MVFHSLRFLYGSNISNTQKARRNLRQRIFGCAPVLHNDGDQYHQLYSRLVAIAGLQHCESHRKETKQKKKNTDFSGRKITLLSMVSCFVSPLMSQLKDPLYVYDAYQYSLVFVLIPYITKTSFVP